MSDAPKGNPARHGLSGRILSGAFWVMAGRVLSVLALFASGAMLSKWALLADAELDAYFLASFLMPFFAVLTNLGSQEILLRDTRARVVSGDLDAVRQSVASCLKICSTCSAVVATALVVGMRWLPLEKLHFVVLRDQMPWVVAWMFFQTMGQVASEGCRGVGRFGWSTALYTKSGGWACNALFAFAVLAVWGRAGQAEFSAIMAAQTAAAAVPAVAGLAVLSRSLRDPRLFDGVEVRDADAPTDASERPRPTVRWMLRESWPLFVAYTIIIGIEQLDIFVVSLFGSDGDVADYGVAKRWLSTINFAFVSMAPAITPFVAELHETGDRKRIERLLRGSATLAAIPTVAISLALFFAAEPAVAHSFGAERLGAVGPLRVQLLAQFLLSFAGHSYLALSMTGHQRSLMQCTAVVGGLYAILGPIATAQWGVVGAASAKSLATAARALFAAFIAYRTLGIWTTASFSPAEIRETFETAFKRGRRAIRR